MTPLGNDLQVEWRSFDGPPPDTRTPWGKVLAIVGLVIMLMLSFAVAKGSLAFGIFFFLLVGTSLALALGIIGALIEKTQAAPALSEFQRHDSRAFHRSVALSLMDAFGRAGVDTEQIERASERGSAARLNPRPRR